MQGSLEIFKGALPTKEIYAHWEEVAKAQNNGALCVFVGIVREEAINTEAQTSTQDSKNQNTQKNATNIESQNTESQNIEALSFDIYTPLLQKWFESWQERARLTGAQILMAHSLGDVPKGASSYMCAVISSKRKAALSLYEEFIEDFKANAPIWKYDVINGKRIFALSRSTPIQGSGVLK
ncbi:molybdenum cofactor biosynthesis protein MoaE [Helicobacter sp. MIT 00-7814]|uniref:molybdopterin synthase catalytic subunit n=1 Tax=unclassified Helicobacter TaxID=2593540 RepID=UPI000E1EB7B5|nr:MULTISPECIES: molybdenum cofactor biosynthesis protein MoaE [unclassified Helicobacter]RDU51822.1 molybdenum cofactor biosynthesis protein MoaE [Helicobacter sp. MIT 99-10781]RDU51835.1 molybdenum cofactor biosynthesis protein MoaE [Helicobacter sp. MIT 00-7814]